ncbi:hypothetical protein EST38_g4586 [Candolleomyces aberdarensis]|uniref:Sodium/calcium exchanger membrane region domain-containing protein n=1 Tax=Candolleomyces aberdarensis TaxID=2316362 RepID=A0A4Q2DMT4_9AGAR|nr:hypothetical protein EST38_g4586 [Candolleomyces aberdarensis]
MPPAPLNLSNTAHPLSQHYHPANSSPNEDASPPPDSRFVLTTNDSESNLVSSDSEDFKGRVHASPGGLPTFYQSDSRDRITIVENTPKRQVLKGSQDWRRHLEGWKLVLLDSWLNLLLLMIPIAWTIRLVMEEAYGLIFSSCILALIPLVRLHDLTIAQLALRVGGSKTGLLNASMVSALRKCELRVVQSSLVGSILSKILLILGLSFFAGGLRWSEQGFNPTATQVHSSLLSISVGVLILPAAYHFALSAGEGEAADLQKRDILRMSHGVSVVLVTIYIAYLAFQLWSHTHLYHDKHNPKSSRLPATQNISAEKAAAYLSARSKSTFQSCKNFGDFDSIRNSGSNSKKLTPPRRPFVSSIYTNGSRLRHSSTTIVSSPEIESRYDPAHKYQQIETRAEIPGTMRLLHSDDGRIDGLPRRMSREETIDVTSSPIPSPTSTVAYTEFGEVERTSASSSGGGDDETIGKPKSKEPQLSWFLTVLLLLTVTAAVTVTADWLVESMDGISTTISKEWVALILLPAVSSVAECITAVRRSVRDELPLSISVAVGSTIQTALFVIPFMVLLGWAINKPLTLLMDPFESLVLYLSVQTLGYVLADGKSNWLEGFILVALYSIIAVSFWFYPGSTPLDFLTVCPR